MHSLSFFFDFKEAILKMQGNILIKKGKTKDIEKLINAFLKMNN